MEGIIFGACKELVDDAKIRCSDLVFKEICLEILARARNILAKEQFMELAQYTAEKMREKSLTEATIPL